jgi:hypothetical protein
VSARISVSTVAFRASIPRAIGESKAEALAKVDRLVTTVTEAAIAGAPVHTGELKESIGRTPLEEIAPDRYRAVIYALARHAAAVEFGWHPGRRSERRRLRRLNPLAPVHGMTPQPFMRRAAALAESLWRAGRA